MSEVTDQEDHNEHYKRVLAATKEEGNSTAEKRVPELYWILRNEESKSPADSRELVKRDLVDTFARVTVDKWIPEEAKEEKKVNAGKKGGKAKSSNSASARALSEKRKKEEEEKQKLQEIILTTGGSTETNPPNTPPDPKTEEEKTDDKLKSIHIDLKQQRIDELEGQLKDALERVDQVQKKNIQLSQVVKKDSFKPASDPDNLNEDYDQKIAIPMLITKLRTKMSSGWHFVENRMRFIS